MEHDEDQDQPLKDRGSFIRHFAEDELSAHHKDRWQNQAMYVGLHFPSSQGKKHKRRHHRHSKNRDSKSGDKTPTEERPPTPPSQRVAFILGQEEDDEDHQSHDIFCEMEELRQDGDDMEWKETARWVKFEEDVEEGGERWSKPHVATLSLHSLFELRKGIVSGTVMLDMEASDLWTIVDLVLDQMISTDQMNFQYKDQTFDVLMAKHRHQHQKKEGKGGLSMVRSLADIGRKHSSKNMDPKEGIGSRRMSTPHAQVAEGLKGNRTSVPNFGDQSQDSDMSRVASTHKFNEHFFKKLPPGAEASNIMVGEVDFLETPVMAFIRLKKSAMLGDLTEVPIPTRFLFILLGPCGHKDRYHEIGRSIATLMSDEVFHEIAYKARKRDDLLAGIDEFLDQVTVLPPGEWDPNIRIEPPKSVPSQESRKKLPPTASSATPLDSNGLQRVPSQPDAEKGKEETEVVDELEGHCDPTLERTGRLFGGLVQDVKRKLPWYWSDIKDAIHIQCVASFFFIYFACLTPIITFGGLLGAATDNNIAAMESLMSGAICGVTWHIFSGQPLTIIGSTGPVLVFETIVFNFCNTYELNYLGLRFWIGIWMAFILFIMVMLDLSALVRYITRFTEESFALLIALIFIVEAFKKLLHIADEAPVDLHPHEPKDYTCYCVPKNMTENENFTTPIPVIVTVPDNSTNATGPIDWDKITKEECADMGGILIGSGCGTPEYVPDVFFFSCLLFIFTFAISFSLKNFRTARFFPNKVRSIVSDFAVMIGIVSMVLLDFVIGLDTPKLLVPDKVKPTRDDRGWIVNPFSNPAWVIPAAILPALLATILIFMDQQITAVIVNRKEHKLRKGGGYHLDLLIIAAQIAICSAVGTPWFVAATVLSINHVRSLTRESETSAPGERPKFLGIREQRVTGTLVFLLVGLSALMSAVLKFIPMPVLFGVFLYMGTSSLKGIQLVQRTMILFMPAKYQPDYVYLRHVPLRRCHLFTFIQILCLAALWVIKSIKSISIVFPLMVLAMCFVRKLLDYIFTRHELRWLDDILPESHKKEKEDKKKKKEEKVKGFVEDNKSKEIEMTGGMINIPLKDGKMVSIPVDKISFDPKTNQLNVSDQFSQSQIWKQLTGNESDPALNMSYGLRQRKPEESPSVGNKEKPRKSNEPVTFSIAEEEDETDHLMGAPEIVVDPPSKGSTRL